MTRPTIAMLRTETKLFIREPAPLFWIIGFPTIVLVILGSIPSFREPSAELGGLRIIDLYGSIVVLLATIFAAVQAMPTVLATYREQEILRRISTTPARASHLLLTQYALHTAAVIGSAILALTTARLAFDVAPPESFPAYLLIMALVLLAMMATGGVISSLAANARIASTVGTIVMFPLMFSAGLWLPVQAMPDIVGRIVEFTPLGAAARGLDQAALGHWPDPGYLVVLTLWALALGALAARYFRWE